MGNTYADKLAAQDAEHTPSLADQIRAKAGETVSEAAGVITAEAKKAIADPERYARRSYVSLAREARNDPVRVVGFAAALGFVFGALSQVGKSSRP